MAKYSLIKRPGGVLIGADDIEQDRINKLSDGSFLECTIVKPNSNEFHKKMFALFRFGFDYWEPEITGKIQAEKNFDRFVDDILILAGYRETVVNIKNEVKYIAKSVSYSSLEDAEKGELYTKIFNVIWRLVLSKLGSFTEEQAHNTINQMMEF